MEQAKMLELFWQRSEKAIEAAQQEYGALCRSIARNLLGNEEDVEECLNDTWLKAWNSMPTERPQILSAFLGAITRNLSLDRYRKNHAKKRGEGQVAYIFEELQDCFSSTGPEEELDAKELVNALNDFLEKLGKQTIKFNTPPSIISTACIVGPKEAEGPLAKYFDQCLEDEFWGEKTWEKAESKIIKSFFIFK